MAREQKWDAVSPQPFTANGNAFGLVTVADTAGFKVKASAYLENTANQTLAVQIKRVLSPTQLIVGAVDNKLSSWTPLDITSWTVSSGAQIGQQVQDKNNIPWEDHYKAIYEADPTVADRVVFVDKYGQFYDLNNPLPISFDGTVQIGDVSIIDPNTKYPLKVNSDGSINVIVESAASSGTVVNTFGGITSVASAATTTLATYTVPSGYNATLTRAVVSGDNIGLYTLSINSSPQDIQRTMFGSNLNASFEFDSQGSGLPLNTGDVVTVQVLNSRPNAANFNARIQVIENAI